VVTTDTDAYTWQRTGPDTAVVVTAVANPGFTLTGQTEYGPYDITQQTENCDAPVTPAAPVFTPGDCDDEGSLIATDTDAYTWTITGPDTALIATATANPGFGLTGQTVYGPYDITQPTQGCNPPPPPPEPTIDVAAFTPVCQADIPFVAWNIVVTGTTANTADITFLDLDGNVVETLTDQPLTGRTIYPGASEDPPDWPGWELNSAGLWVPDPSDANLRDGLDIVVEVNPTAEAAVEYPAATEACASPTNPTPSGGAGSNQPGGGAASNLPVTGGETLLTALFALLLLSTGGSIILFARRNPS
jgi:hypothetical protein